MIATIAVVKKVWAEIKKNSVRMFQGEITLDKKDGWLIGAILLLTGIAIGFLNAPLTHGINISIASNNGNGSGCNNGNGSSCNSDGWGEKADEKADELCKLDVADAEKENVSRKVKRPLQEKMAKTRHKGGKKRKRKIPSGRK